MWLAALFLLAAGAATAQSASPQQLFQEAVEAQQKGDDALAIRKYQELLKLHPEVIEARANLGAALAKVGRFDEAIDQYRGQFRPPPQSGAGILQEGISARRRRTP